MRKDITLGQYYPTGSLIHQLDPRVKMLAVFFYMFFLFFNDFAAAYVIHFVILTLVIQMTKIPLGKIIESLKAIWFLLLFSVFFTVFFTNGEDIIWEWGIVHISWQGVILAVKICVRIFMLILMSALLTLTTTPGDLADGLEKAFRPLNKVGVPVHEIAMMLTIALRFIPILMEEADRIMRAQKARGADFETGNFIQKAKKLVPIFIPLIVSAVKRSMDLAVAMEARCYRGGGGRTKMKPLRYGKLDKAVYVILAGYVVFMIMIYVMRNKF